MKKKLLTMALSLTLAFSLAACGSPEVSGPVDRDPISTTDESQTETSSAEESSEETVSALAKWYDSSDRTFLEDTINKTFASSGMTFSLSIEEPDTIIYTYQYTENQSDDSNREILRDYFRTSLDEQYETFAEEIQNFKDAYGMPLTTIRISYLDADGTDLYTMDFTEDYVPSTDISSSQEEYASLEDWINSDEKKMGVDAVNSELEPAGISVDLYAEGNVLIMDYTYTEQQDLEGLTQEDISAVFEESVLPAFSSLITDLFDSFESDYGLVLDDIKLIYRNADGTELFSKYYSEL